LKKKIGEKSVQELPFHWSNSFIDDFLDLGQQGIKKLFDLIVSLKHFSGGASTSVVRIKVLFLAKLFLTTLVCITVGI